MASFKLFLTTFLVFVTSLEQSLAGDKWMTIELDGKFTQQRSGYGTTVSTKAGFDLRAEDEVARDKRAAVQEPPLDFTGTITVKSPHQTVVIGVNSTFRLTDVEETQVNGFASNRVKREDIKKTRLAFFGQFALGEVLPTSEVLNVKINIDTWLLSEKRVSPEKEIFRMGEPQAVFLFKGKLNAKDGKSNEILNFALNLGLRDDSVSKFDYDEGQGSDANRVKREAKPLTLEVDGELTVTETRQSGDKKILVLAVKGDAIFEPVRLPTQTPKESFFAAREDSSQFLVETAGNVTGKMNDATVFSTPLTTGFRFSAPEREKRGDSMKDKVFGLDYDGVLATTYRRNRQVLTVSASFKFWLISQTPAIPA